MTPVFVLRVVARADGRPTAEAGRYVSFFDPDLAEGRGLLRTTPDPETAIHFPDRGSALACWQRQSAVAPYRSDLKPNRPLTCYTIEMVPFESVRGPDRCMETGHGG